MYLISHKSGFIVPKANNKLFCWFFGNPVERVYGLIRLNGDVFENST